MPNQTHRDIKKGLRAMEHLNGDWEEDLPTVLLAIRTSVCSLTGITPFNAMFGREAVLPLDIIYNDNISYDDENDLKALRARLGTIYGYMNVKGSNISAKPAITKIPKFPMTLGLKCGSSHPRSKRQKGPNYQFTGLDPR